MPSDIRSFFGGKPAAAPAPQEQAPEVRAEVLSAFQFMFTDALGQKSAAKKGRSRKKVVDDSEEEDELVAA